MKNILTILLLSLSLVSFSQELTPNDFKELNNIKAEAGKSSRKMKAAKFKQMYNKYDRDVFKKVMFEYLENTSYKDIDDYFWYSVFLTSDYYISTTDKDLGLELLQKGKIEIEDRLKNNDNSEEQELYLSMTRCQVLWSSGIFYFNENDLEKGGQFFDLAYENPDCIHAFPGTTKEEKEEIYKKYAEYKNN